MFDMMAFMNVDNAQQAADETSKTIRTLIKAGKLEGSTLGKQGCAFPIFELKVVNPDYKNKFSAAAAWSSTVKVEDPDRCTDCGNKLPDTLHAEQTVVCGACEQDLDIATDEADAPVWQEEIKKQTQNFVDNLFIYANRDSRKKARFEIILPVCPCF